MKKYIAECVGTAVLVIVGCGTAVVTGADVVATALAFGLAIVAMAYSIGNVSGCHVNPAVSLGCLLAGRMDKKDFVGYVVAQVIGAVVGALILAGMVGGPSTGLGVNSYSAIGAGRAFLVEVVLTCIFVLAILGVTDSRFGNGAKGGVVIGFTLTLVHLLGIKLTGTSVNPARSLGPAILVGGDALAQVWLFIVAPLVGAALAACIYNAVAGKDAKN